MGLYHSLAKQSLCLIRCLWQESPDSIFEFFLHVLDADDVPDVFRRNQAEDQAGKENGGAGPFKLASLSVWAKCPAPYHISMAGFQTLAPEPCLHLSMHTALHLLIQFSRV